MVNRIRPMLRFAITGNPPQQALARYLRGRVVDLLWGHPGNLSLQPGQTGELILSVVEISQAILGRQHQRFKFMALDVGLKPPVTDLVLESLFKAFTPCSCVLISRLRGPARKVIGQAIEVTERCEPEVRASIAVEAVPDVTLPLGVAITTTGARSTPATIGSLGLANDRGTYRYPKLLKMGTKNTVHKIPLGLPLNHNDQALGRCGHQGRPPTTPLAKISRTRSGVVTPRRRTARLLAHP